MSMSMVLSVLHPSFLAPITFRLTCTTSPIHPRPHYLPPHLHDFIAVYSAGILQAHIERDAESRRRQDNGLWRAAPRPRQLKCGVTQAKPEFPEGCAARGRRACMVAVCPPQSRN